MSIVTARALMPVVALLALAGCDAASPSDNPAPATVTTPPAASTGVPPRSAVATPPTGFAGLELGKSGGIAGVAESVTIEADGTWQRLDGGKAVASGKLTDAQLTELRTLAANPRLAVETARQATFERCADGFTYELTVLRPIRYMDCGPGDEPQAARAVVAFVEGATTAR
jgi:hypothetical protein